uniref:Uncharacterized protein n=1 Tax=Strongyloides stercoralis TaxID=6248 RepID=A0A0K0EPK5_STRER
MASNNSSNKLVEGLNNISTTSSLIKKQAENQIKAINCLSKWAASNDNIAIEDVTQKILSLFEIFTDKLLQLAHEQDVSIKELKKIEQTECSVKAVEGRLERFIEKEKKLEKEIMRHSSSSSSSFSTFFRIKKGNDLDVLRHSLNETRKAKANTTKELDDIKAEMEVVKMFRFRKGMEKMSVAWKNFAHDISLIFACQQELVEMVPAIATEDVREMFYIGSSSTTSMVDDLKRKLNYSDSFSSIRKITSEVSTVKTPRLIKKKEFLLPSLSVGAIPKIKGSVGAICSSFRKLSTDSDYSSCGSFESYESKAETSITTSALGKEEDNGYEKLYPSLPPNPYIDRQGFVNKKDVKTNFYISTGNPISLSKKSVTNQDEKNGGLTSHLLQTTF